MRTRARRRARRRPPAAHGHRHRRSRRWCRRRRSARPAADSGRSRLEDPAQVDATRLLVEAALRQRVAAAAQQIAPVRQLPALGERACERGRPVDPATPGAGRARRARRPGSRRRAGCGAPRSRAPRTSARSRPPSFQRRTSSAPAPRWATAAQADENDGTNPWHSRQEATSSASARRSGCSTVPPQARARRCRTRTRAARGPHRPRTTAEGSARGGRRAPRMITRGKRDDARRNVPRV